MNHYQNLIDKIHLGVNPYEGFPGHAWPTDFFGWRSEHEYFDRLIQDLRPGLIIEVGSFLGGSAINMARLLAKNELAESAILCVDTWLAEQILWTIPEHRDRLKMTFGSPCFYYTFLSNVMARGCQDKIVPLRMPSLSASRLLRQLDIRAKLVYIDGCHEEGDVLRDLEAYWDLLLPGGAMLIDDYSPQGDVMFAGLVSDVDRFASDQGLLLEAANDKAILYKP